MIFAASNFRISKIFGDRRQDFTHGYSHVQMRRPGPTIKH
jgi:hypothetical protein